jgi:hypothetical protein
MGRPKGEGSVGIINGQVHEDELIMGLTERECRSALLMLAYATTSLTSEDDDEDDDTDDDEGLNLMQAAIAEDAARTAIRAVLAETRGIAIHAPALEVRGRFRPPKVTKIESRRERAKPPDDVA